MSAPPAKFMSASRLDEFNVAASLGSIWVNDEVVEMLAHIEALGLQRSELERRLAAHEADS